MIFDKNSIDENLLRACDFVVTDKYDFLTYYYYKALDYYIVEFGIYYLDNEIYAYQVILKDLDFYEPFPLQLSLDNFDLFINDLQSAIFIGDGYRLKKEVF